MAAYLALRHKADGKLYTGAALVQVDEMLARAMGDEPDPEEWYRGWMDCIGFALAFRSDKPVAEALSHLMVDSMFGPPEPDLVTACEWFIANFENDSYHRR